ncbi:MAG: flagellar FlbD family protein [Solobacterium sp.]|nr:flagellar FlbD family protein [Solobacterium sp.]
MTFVKLTSTNGKPLLLKVKSIESVRAYVVGRLSYGDIVATEEYATEIKLTNGNKYIVEESVEEVGKALGGTNDI